MHATLLNAPGDDLLVLATVRDPDIPGAGPVPIPVALARLREQARGQRWTGFQRPWAVFRLQAPAGVDPVQNVFAPPVLTAPAPPEPWRSPPTRRHDPGRPLLPGLQREASQRRDNALEFARFSYHQLRILGVDPAQAAQVLPPPLLESWEAAGSLYAWGRFCQACTAATTPAERYGLATQVAAALEACFPLTWPLLCAALATPAAS